MGGDGVGGEGEGEERREDKSNRKYAVWEGWGGRGVWGERMGRAGRGVE